MRGIQKQQQKCCRNCESQLRALWKAVEQQHEILAAVHAGSGHVNLEAPCGHVLVAHTVDLWVLDLSAGRMLRCELLAAQVLERLWPAQQACGSQRGSGCVRAQRRDSV